MIGFVFAAVLAAAFTNDIATLEIDRAGRVKSLRERESGRELVTNRVSFCWLQRNGRRGCARSVADGWIPPASTRRASPSRAP